MGRTGEIETTNLLLVRHAHSEGNGGKLLSGSSDVPLSQRGYQEAIDARVKLDPFKPFGEIYAADLRRASKTIYLATGTEPETFPHLRERHFGRDENKPLTPKHIHFLSNIPFKERLDLQIAEGAETDRDIWERWLLFFKERGEVMREQSRLGKTNILGTHSSTMDSIISGVSEEKLAYIGNTAVVFMQAAGNPSSPDFVVRRDLSSGIRFHQAA